MNRKGIAGAIIVIMIICLLIVIGGVVYFVINQNELIPGEGDEEQNTTGMRLILELIDAETYAIPKSTYKLYGENYTLISTGDIEPREKREIKINTVSPYTIVCSGENHYLDYAEKTLTALQIQDGIAVIRCSMRKIADGIEMAHRGDISGDESEINLAIKPHGYLQKPSLCMAWTSGFLSVSLSNNTIRCTEEWRNYSYYNATSKVYDWLPQGEYFCAGRTEKCEQVSGTHCHPPQTPIPLRLRSLVDKCEPIGRDLRDETEMQVKIEKLSFATRFDEIMFYLIDEDRRFVEGQFRYFSEFEGKDIGAKDSTYLVAYEGK